MILYLYSAKVIINWEWPRYKATYLVGLFSAPGILATLLLFPLSVSTWVRKYTRTFFILLLPLVLMMLVCVYRRVSEHGLTEMMVVAITMGIWLVFVSIYMLRTRGENIRMMPVTLVAFLILISFGPLSAPSLGLSSQTVRLREILIRAKIADGKIPLDSKEKIKLSLKDYTALTDKVRYLTDHFGTASLTAMVTNGTLPKNSYEANNAFISHFLNTEPQKAKTSQYHLFSTKPLQLPIGGFNALVRHNGYRSDTAQILKGEGYQITINWEKNLLLVERGKNKGSVDFGTIYAKLSASEPVEGNVAIGKLTHNFRIGSKRARIYFTRMAGEDLARDIEFVILLP